MSYLIDSVCLILLIWLFAIGFRRGFLASLLKIIQITLGLTVGIVVGYTIGINLAEWINRPRIVTIPVSVLFFGTLTIYLLHIFISFFNQRKKIKPFKLYMLPDKCAGIILGLLSCSVCIIISIWIFDLSYGVIKKKELSLKAKSIAITFTYQSVRSIAYSYLSNKYSDDQAKNIAASISFPSRTIHRAYVILSSKSIQQIMKDPEINDDILSGDEERISNNTSMQFLFNDIRLTKQLKEMGINYLALPNLLADIGKNKNIMRSIKNLQIEKKIQNNELLSLIRDPNFDTIVKEISK